MKLYCYDCGEQVAIIERGSKIKKLSIMLCERCNTDRFPESDDVFDTDSHSDSFTTLRDIFGGFKT